MKEKISQGLGTLKRQSVEPWTFQRDGSLKVLAGLLPWVWPDHEWPHIQCCLDEGQQYRLDQLREAGWRPMQIAAIEAALRAPLGRGIISVGTGGGKTRIAYGLAYASSQKDPWLYVVYGRDLVTQAREDFFELHCLLRRGEHGDPYRAPPQFWDRTIRVEGYGNAHGRGVFPFPCPGLVIDECHEIGAEHRARVVTSFRGGWRVGMSGSALERTDDRNTIVVGLLGPIIFSVGVADLTIEGHLTPGKVITVPFRK